MHKPIPWTVDDILKATDGRLLSGATGKAFEGISIDSRTIEPGDLYVAIRGQRHDGHTFIKEILARGCRGIVVDTKDAVDRTALNDAACVVVDNTTLALGDLASFQRRRANARIIAITGSNGKTTTKEMTHSILSQAYPTLATRGNLNNEIGLPLTLFRLGYHHQWAVLELGMNRPGEIRTLARICRPDVGVITNVGPAHLEGLGSLDGVMQAKGELLPWIAPGGTTILNADDARVMRLAATAVTDVLLFGTATGAAVRAEKIRPEGRGYRFQLITPGGTVDIALPLAGEFMVSNALAAAATACAAGIGPDVIKRGLETAPAVPGRMQIHQIGEGINVIDDTYNANPGSMRGAIATLVNLKGNHRAFLVIGDMAELGDHAERMHVDIGAVSARSGIERLYATGSQAAAVARGAEDEGMAAGSIVIGEKADIIRDVRRHLQPGDWVLVKGSRSTGMEQVVNGIMTSISNDEGGA